MNLIQKKDDTGKVETGGVIYDVNLTLVPDADIGDYVLIHAGFAIEKLDQAEAQKTLDLFQEMYRAGEDH
jgi:hydrogenase expression/formation protein HypC